MEFQEVIDRQKTSREWTERNVDFSAIERIIEAGMKAPSWDHYRNCQYTMLTECPYVIVPLFQCRKLNAEWVSKLNHLTAAWALKISCWPQSMRGWVILCASP